MSSGSSTTERVFVGRILRAHGLGGEVVVENESDLTARWARGVELRAGEERTVRIDRVRRHQGRLLVTFEGTADRTAAETLRGLPLSVPRSEVPSPPAGEHWEWQLVGCRCEDAVLGDLGTVTGVIEDGGGMLLVVSTEQGELLVPYVRDIVVEVALEDGRIRTRLPPGLVELCGSA